MRDDVALSLDPERGVGVENGVCVALDTEPWLRLRGVAIDSLLGCFVEIAMHTSLWDEPCRPLIRFWNATSFIDVIAAGPIAGASLWVGRVPPSTTGISFSPTNRLGRFDFSVDRVRSRSWSALVADGLRWRRRQARSALLTRLIGWKPESDVNLAWATRSLPLSALERWRPRHERLPDFGTIDRPRATSSAPTITIIVFGVGDAEPLRRTLGSLKSQIFARWSVLVVDGKEHAEVDPRAKNVEMSALLDATSQAGPDSIIGVLAAGDLLPPLALAHVAEQASRHPGARLFYGDELQESPGGHVIPLFKPGWSPRLEQARSYLGRGLFVRPIDELGREDRQTFFTTGKLPKSWLGSLDAKEVVPLRRILVKANQRPLPPVMAAPPRSTAAAVSIIIPTRDHPALLRRAVASIRARSKARAVQIVVIDNGSSQEESLALLVELRGSFDVLQIDHPGDFNFSLMCNEAAAASAGEVLVFLNDDTEIRSEDWLDRLAAHALDEIIGAVGAKLTYPDGRLQHVGVVLGMGETAGHFGALAPGDDPGWVGRNEVVHEVSAVTGACLAVSRAKFQAVGGFDAEHLPIELSDIDLCLKLNERGWQTIVDPNVHIMHEESASRGGATFRRLDVYGKQREVFVDRWRHVLRDDPFFHPGLSLYWWQPALG